MRIFFKILGIVFGVVVFLFLIAVFLGLCMSIWNEGMTNTNKAVVFFFFCIGKAIHSAVVKMSKETQEQVQTVFEYLLGIIFLVALSCFIYYSLFCLN